MDITDLKYWAIGQIRDFVREVQKSVGADGWNLLVPRLQQALIHEKVLMVHLTNDGRLNKAAIIELRVAMMDLAGLAE